MASCGTSGSYYEQHRRQRGVTPTLLESEKLLTDRGEYQSFLEIQLERVSAACLQAQGFDERIDKVTGQFNSLETKIASMAHLVHLANSCGDEKVLEMARGMGTLSTRVAELEKGSSAHGHGHHQMASKLAALEARVAEMDAHQRQQDEHHSTALKDLASINSADHDTVINAMKEHHDVTIAALEARYEAKSRAQEEAAMAKIVALEHALQGALAKANEASTELEANAQRIIDEAKVRRGGNANSELRWQGRTGF